MIRNTTLRLRGTYIFILLQLLFEDTFSQDKLCIFYGSPESQNTTFHKTQHYRKHILENILWKTQQHYRKHDISRNNIMENTISPKTQKFSLFVVFALSVLEDFLVSRNITKVYY